MNELTKVKSFLETVAYEEKRCKCLNAVEGQNPFVTISRQAGAGGNTLAATVLEQLKERNDSLFKGWQRFDNELCQKIADEPGLKVSVDQLIKSEYQPEREDMMNEIVVGTSSQYAVHKVTFRLVRSLATCGKVILVGRGGVCLTRDLPLGIHIRLVAPLEIRIERMSGLLSLTGKKAKELVLKQDKARARLMKTYFSKNIDDPLLYDSTWNTGTVPIDQIAYSIVKMIEKKSCLCTKPPLFHELASTDSKKFNSE